MPELKLGVIACLHGKVDVAEKIVKIYHEKDLDAVALIGDVPSDEAQYENFKRILETFAELDVPIFVSPGSHEHYKDYYSALEEFEEENIIDCSTVQKHFVDGHNLVFLPGSSVSASGAGFKLLADRSEEEEFRERVEERSEHFTGKIVPIFAEDVKEIAESDSILITHDPPKFAGKDGIDLAKFGEAKKAFEIKNEHGEVLTSIDHRKVEPEWPFPLEEAKEMKELGYPFEIKEDNVGDGFLNEVLQETGVTMMVCGHIHESGGRAVDTDGNPVEEGEWSKELLYNCAAGKDGRAGIVEFRDGKARYRNIEF